jgi:hypothetical protein
LGILTGYAALITAGSVLASLRTEMRRLIGCSGVVAVLAGNALHPGPGRCRSYSCCARGM